MFHTEGVLIIGVQVPVRARALAFTPAGAVEAAERCAPDALAELRGLAEEGWTASAQAALTVVEAGEHVFHTFLWTKTVFHALREAQSLSHARFGVKTLSGTLLGPAFKACIRVTGLGRRTRLGWTCWSG